MPQGKDRRARRRAERRHAIRMAAVRVALERGLDGATVEAISEAAGVSQRTFFNYFPVKEDALTVEPGWSPEELRELVAARPPEEGGLVVMRAVMGGLARRFVDMFEGMELVRELHRRHPELAARSRQGAEDQMLAPMMDEIRTRPGVRSRLHARLLVVASFGAALSAVHEAMSPEGPALPLDTLLDEAFDLLATGL
ncbi:TetR family transcriptional regulator [Bailinhaonella thermotolerans]|uniref:TetR family transcriptional regulator n=1 Tax=Bailinhaonella thermotolerans TaxID=1070861 RepID=A0A3A4ANH4_9ACTN|nr:TetR family transcriptional regulator [Bailinhaonella thermotolerans]RJL30099.1 TetR family transcriptional regulator [Bailinhaonella thermotolerans]